MAARRGGGCFSGEDGFRIDRSTPMAPSSRPRERGSASWPSSRSSCECLLCELELQRADVKRVTHLGIVKGGEAELVGAVQIVELDVILAAGHKLARQYDAPLAVAPRDVGRDVAAVAGKWCDQDRSHFVAGLEFAVIEGGRVGVLQVIGAALVRRRAALVHELRLAVNQLDVIVAAAGLRVALASGLGSLVLVVAGVIEILIIGLAVRTGADRFHVPDVAELALARRVLIAKRFTRLAGMAGGHATHLAEVLDRVPDVPNERNLIFIIDVVVSALVLRIAQFLPAPVGLLLIRKAAYRLGWIVVLHEHVD